MTSAAVSANCCDDLRPADPLGLIDLQTQCESSLLDRGDGDLLASALRPVRLGVDSRDIVPGLNESFECGHRKCGVPMKIVFNAVALGQALLRPLAGLRQFADLAFDQIAL